MSLWDTDKSSDRRDNPELNANDQLLQYVAKGTLSTNSVTNETDSTLLGGTTGSPQGDALTIVGSGAMSLTTTDVSSTAGNFTAGHFETTADFNLNFVPGIIGFESVTNRLMPFTYLESGGSGIGYWVTYSVKVGAIGGPAVRARFNIDVLVYGGGTVAGQTVIANVYLLRLPTTVPTIPNPGGK